MKFGIIVPDDITHARRLHKENCNGFCEQAIRKEVSNVAVAFQLLEHDEPTPIGSKHIT